MPNSHVEHLLPLLSAGLKLSVSLQFGPKDTYAFNSEYVGCKVDRFLLIDLPKKVQEALVMRQVSNVTIVVRAITQSKLGHIIAFKTSVLSIVNHPTNLMLLRIPSHFASKPIRNHERYPVDMPITVLSNTVSYNATMLDFSINGCAIFIGGENALESDSVIEIDSEFNAFFSKEMQLTIVSIEKQRTGHKFGIKFSHEVEMNTELKQALLEKAFLATPL